MRQHSDPDHLSPEQRRQAIAVVLAAGLLRLTERPPTLHATRTENLADSSGDCLEVSGETRLSVHTG
jgi:hypothetical protein